jgi:hypothetical protein
VYRVTSEGLLQPVSLAKLVQVEVDELKSPLQILLMKPEDRTQDEIAAVFWLRERLIQGTQNLNALRAQSGLPPFEIDKGKRSTSRKDLAGGLALLLHPKGKDKELKKKKLDEHHFFLNPETGYWVDWESGGRYLYHPSMGVFQITSGLNSPGPMSIEPVYFRKP